MIKAEPSRLRFNFVEFAQNSEDRIQESGVSLPRGAAVKK
jgi:hypothetical protein